MGGSNNKMSEAACETNQRTERKQHNVENIMKVQVRRRSLTRVEHHASYKSEYPSDIHGKGAFTC